jgi:hypothetical protein
MNNNTVIKKWIKLGIISGLLVSLIYPALIFVSMPDLVQTFFVMIFGPLLGLASTGLYFFISLHKKSISSSIAFISNIIAGVLITTMLLIQMGIRSTKPESLDKSDEWIWKSFNQVYFGLDVAWDVYIFFGTLLFAIGIFDHPKFGKVLSVIGIIISILLISFNAISLPNPPANAGLIDMGPFIGLWYLALTIIMISSLKWVDAKTIGEIK